MKRVIYFNVNYICNNRCLFCFSSSTSGGDRKGCISHQEMLRRIKAIEPNSDDLIVINGGEPTLHPQFYELLISLMNCNNARIVVYTNAISLDVTQLVNSEVTFVIPIHGSASVHNEITQNPTSYDSTMACIQELQNANYQYSLKFIINEEMIFKGFNIKEFLIENRLSPSEVILARMNETKTSRKNCYAVPQPLDVKRYFNYQVQVLKNFTALKILDIPPCFVDELSASKPINVFQNKPQFYFNDEDHVMEKRDYYKQVKIGDHCRGCVYEELCDLMSESYLTLAFVKKWLIIPE